MIFVTTGTQLPFDRLVKAIDTIAQSFTHERFTIQVQNYKTIKVSAKNVTLVGFVDPVEFNKLFIEAHLIIGHAGMGTIIKALENNKPLIVFPRKAHLNEHRNEHQMATVKRLSRLKLINAAESAQELFEYFKTYEDLKIMPFVNEKIGPIASSQLIHELKTVINQS